MARIEITYHVFILDREKRTFTPAFLQEGELARIHSHGGIGRTPLPLIFISPTNNNGEREIRVDDALVGLAFNEELYRK